MLNKKEEVLPASKNKARDQARFIAGVVKKLRAHIFAIQSSLHDGTGSCKGEELSVAQVQTVMAVHSLGEVTISNLAAELNVSPPSVSNMVDRLVEKKVLIRERSKQDRRKVVVRLSERAMARATKMEGAVLAAFYDLVEKVGPKTAEKWCEVLACVEQVLAESGKKNAE